jgi:hypothetical protein
VGEKRFEDRRRKKILPEGTSRRVRFSGVTLGREVQPPPIFKSVQPKDDKETSDITTNDRHDVTKNARAHESMCGKY